MIKLLLAAAAIGLYFVVSTHDYHSEVKAERAYVQNVCSGVWPNYKNLNLDCTSNEVQGEKK